ncbi:MAG: alpha-mannosidase, partial [Clostridia bacterium]|nr:alpha-mannosidase [Clostridia bacterium]
MLDYISKINKAKKTASGYWAERLFSQLEYAVKISKVYNGTFDVLMGKTVGFLETELNKAGTITKDIVLSVEKNLAEMSLYAKKYTLLCVSHAHIDMNWMWDYSETVAITLGTFRTMLDLMDGYPDFTFSQSQASVYRIVEKHDPEMLAEIKARVKEGRWEVTASTWVEADKNMPNGESHARHILYTKRYLSELLDLSPNTLLLDYEPDTFGHNKNVPEILSKGGVKYYYHCRAVEDQSIYKWRSPSGRSILVFKDPMWYNLKINGDAALYVPEFCEKHGIDSVMKVYGVGDHGGGPTRKDIEKLIDMGTWPIYPRIKFSTYSEFYKKIEEIKESLPVVEGELNFVFSGCYTTQARIKTANRIGEARLDEAEAISAVAKTFADGIYPKKNYEKAWRKVLFNQFHDIIPGSGIVDTREYARGEFQKVLAYANTGITKAIERIASKINTSLLKLPEENIKESRAEGAGVGFEMGNFNIPHPERGSGLNRIITVFNPTQFERKEITEILIWDWEGERDRLSVKNSKGESVKSQVLEFNDKNYWDHTFTRLLIVAEVPAYGYSTYVIYEEEAADFEVAWSMWPRLEKPDVFILENDLVKAEFDDVSMRLKSFIDKTTGDE